MVEDRRQEERKKVEEEKEVEGCSRGKSIVTTLSHTCAAVIVTAFFLTVLTLTVIDGKSEAVETVSFTETVLDKSIQSGLLIPNAFIVTFSGIEDTMWFRQGDMNAFEVGRTYYVEAERDYKYWTILKVEEIK